MGKNISSERSFWRRLELSGMCLLVEGDRTPDLMTASEVTSTASGYGSYDLLTFVTGCSRQRVYLLPPIQISFAVVLSQVCLSRNFN